MVNLEFILSIGNLSGVGNGTNVDLGGLGNTPVEEAHSLHPAVL